MRAMTGTLLLSLLCVGLVSYSCQRNSPAVDNDAAATTATGPRVAVAAIANPSDGNSKALAAAVQQRHDQAMYDAVSAVHRYVAALAANDVDKVRAAWVDGRPDLRGEVALAKLGEMRSLRIENGTPQALDKQAVPEAVEIPIRLRASVVGAPQVNYTGYYRLRRVGDAWLITSAAVYPQIR